MLSIAYQGTSVSEAVSTTDESSLGSRIAAYKAATIDQNPDDRSLPHNTHSLLPSQKAHQDAGRLEPFFFTFRCSTWRAFAASALPFSLLLFSNINLPNIKLLHLIASLALLLCSLVSLSSATQDGLAYHDALREASLQARGWQLTTRSASDLSDRDNFFEARDVRSALKTLHRRAADFDANVLQQLIARGGGSTWGQGKYTMDIHDYHKNLKPALIKGFGEQGVKLPGKNPDFHIDRKGNVQASATGGKSNGGKNPSLHIADDLNLGHHFNKRGGGSTWGQGKYTMDIHDYHKNLKPALIKGFGEQGVKLPGKNPDFHIDRKGNVQASATGGKGASGKNPSLHIADDLNLGHHFNKRGGGSTWGQGKYTMDIHDYHKNLKPALIKGFGEQGVKLPGRNPDFHIDRKGNVQASATGGKGASGKNPSVHIDDLGLGHHFKQQE